MRYYEGLFRLSSDYLRGLGEVLTSQSTGEARPREPDKTAPASSAVILEAEGGQLAQGFFAVQNQLAQSVSARVASSPLLDPNGQEVPSKIHCEPQTVDLGPGQQAVVRVLAEIDDRLEPGIGYRGTLSIPGISDAAPLVVRRLYSAGPTEPAEDTVVKTATTAKKRAPVRKKTTTRKRTAAKNHGEEEALMSGAPGGSMAEGYLVQAMWWYAGTVLYPSQALKRLGLVSQLDPGELPEPLERPGLGTYFCHNYPAPVFLAEATEHDYLVEDFDRMGEVYDAYLQPFSRPIFDEAVSEMRAFSGRKSSSVILPSHSRTHLDLAEPCSASESVDCQPATSVKEADREPENRAARWLGLLLALGSRTAARLLPPESRRAARPPTPAPRSDVSAATADRAEPAKPRKGNAGG